MTILTNCDQFTNNNDPGKWNLIPIRVDYDKTTECQTNIIERRNNLWKLHLLGSFSSMSHRIFLKRVNALERRKSNSEYQRPNILFKSRWLCNTRSTFSDGYLKSRLFPIFPCEWRISKRWSEVKIVWISIILWESPSCFVKIATFPFPQWQDMNSTYNEDFLRTQMKQKDDVLA